jgi:peptidoglycan/LPS O-acetylase OafA/YrhL
MAINDWLERGRGLFLGGAGLALLDFALPWFRGGEYSSPIGGGWNLLVEEGRYFTVPVAIGYLALLLAGGTLLTRGPAAAGAGALLALFMTLVTLAVVGLAAIEYAATALGRDRTLIPHLGLILLLPGQALLLGGAIAAWVANLQDELLAPGGDR